jgi:hypothetical protein
LANHILHQHLRIGTHPNFTHNKLSINLSVLMTFHNHRVTHDASALSVVRRLVHLGVARFRSACRKRSHRRIAFVSSIRIWVHPKVYRTSVVAAAVPARWSFCFYNFRRHLSRSLESHGARETGTPYERHLHRGSIHVKYTSLMSIHYLQILVYGHMIPSPRLVMPVKSVYKSSG